MLQGCKAACQQFLRRPYVFHRSLLARPGETRSGPGRAPAFAAAVRTAVCLVAAAVAAHLDDVQPAVAGGAAPLSAEPVHSALLAGALAALLLFIYSLLAARLSYVECTPTHLRVSTPFFWLAISYNRVRLVKSVQFAPGRMPLGRRRYAQPLAGQTQVTVELFHYPVHRNWP